MDGGVGPQAVMASSPWVVVLVICLAGFVGQPVGWQVRLPNLNFTPLPSLPYSLGIVQYNTIASLKDNDITGLIGKWENRETRY
jgi:hypothetical protein